MREVFDPKAFVGISLINPEAFPEQLILEQEVDENYEPTKDEIIQYARYLGMDADQDRDLFYIA